MNDRTKSFGNDVKPGEVLLKVDGLCQYFGSTKAVDDVSFEIMKGEVFGLVGESGCGKSVTSMSIMRLLQGPTGQIYSGAIRFNAKEKSGEEKIYDIAKMPMRDIYKIRGSQIAMIFQEPMT